MDEQLSGCLRKPAPKDIVQCYEALLQSAPKTWIHVDSLRKVLRNRDPFIFPDYVPTEAVGFVAAFRVLRNVLETSVPPEARPSTLKDLLAIARRKFFADRQGLIARQKAEEETALLKTPLPKWLTNYERRKVNEFLDALLRSDFHVLAVLLVEGGARDGMIPWGRLEMPVVSEAFAKIPSEIRRRQLRGVMPPPRTIVWPIGITPAELADLPAPSNLYGSPKVNAELLGFDRARAVVVAVKRTFDFRLSRIGA